MRFFFFAMMTPRSCVPVMVRDKAAVIQCWVDAGRMAPVGSNYLFFTIWAATRATEQVVQLILWGCGLLWIK
jgi:YcdC-like protein, C-terminal region